MSALIRCASVAVALLVLSACDDPLPSLTKEKCASKGGQMAEVTFWTMKWGWEHREWLCVIKVEPTP